MKKVFIAISLLLLSSGSRLAAQTIMDSNTAYKEFVRLANEDTDKVLTYDALYRCYAATYVVMTTSEKTSSEYSQATYNMTHILPFLPNAAAFYSRGMSAVCARLCRCGQLACLCRRRLPIADGLCAVVLLCRSQPGQPATVRGGHSLPTVLHPFGRGQIPQDGVHQPRQGVRRLQPVRLGHRHAGASHRELSYRLRLRLGGGEPLYRPQRQRTAAALCLQGTRAPTRGRDAAQHPGQTL